MRQLLVQGVSRRPLQWTTVPVTGRIRLSPNGHLVDGLECRSRSPGGASRRESRRRGGRILATRQVLPERCSTGIQTESSICRCAPSRSATTTNRRVLFCLLSTKEKKYSQCWVLTRFLQSSSSYVNFNLYSALSQWSASNAFSAVNTAESDASSAGD